MTTADREASVRQTTQRWLDATVKADVDTLDSLLETGYTFTHATTAITDSREEWLESFRSGGRRYNAWEIFDVTVRLFPCAAIMTGRGRQEVVRPNDEVFELRTSFSNVWVEQDGRWLLAVWQATLVPDG